MYFLSRCDRKPNGGWSYLHFLYFIFPLVWQFLHAHLSWTETDADITTVNRTNPVLLETPTYSHPLSCSHSVCTQQNKSKWAISVVKELNLHSPSTDSDPSSYGTFYFILTITMLDFQLPLFMPCNTVYQPFSLNSAVSPVRRISKLTLGHIYEFKYKLTSMWWQALTVSLMGSTMITWEMGILPCLWESYLNFVFEVGRPATGHHSLGWDPDLHK